MVLVFLLLLFIGLELEIMVCGSFDIFLDLLKFVVMYKGVEVNVLLVCWFWEILESFLNVECFLFFWFVWGCICLLRIIVDF